MNIAGVLMIDQTTQSWPDPYYLAIDFIPKSTPLMLLRRVSVYMCVDQGCSKIQCSLATQFTLLLASFLDFCIKFTLPTV